jgi:hypothetical protein
MPKSPRSAPPSAEQKNGKVRKKQQVSERDQQLVECVDKALDNYGDSVKQVIYWKLENTFGVKKKAIPENPEKMVATLEDMFGHGAMLIEKSILNEISNVFPGGIVDPTKFVEAFKSAREK